MNTNDAAVIVAAVAVSATALIAASVDRFRHVAAGSFAVLAGVAPWLALHNIYTGLTALPLPLWLVGLFGSAPFFLVALILYALGKRAEGRSGGVVASIAGLIVGGLFSVMTCAIHVRNLLR